jgi:PPK2 family polyphosphate:nucleotide phosphotransferase
VPAFLEPPKSKYRVPFDGRFEVGSAATAPPRGAPDDKQCRRALNEVSERLDDLQRKLYASDHHAVLCMFQAMDAAGKDSTIRAVFGDLNPAGFQVFSFKQPSMEELDHDFLCRTSQRMPERGRIGIFNRSYYEEVLVVRVHPEYLAGQKLPEPHDRKNIWRHRLDSIREHEKHLARNGTVILKFWLNVSKQEQQQRFLSRIRTPEKNWKFSESDVEERRHWDRYMHAYEQALRATSRAWAPWYAIPADSKPFMRLTVARILLETLESMHLAYPELDEGGAARLAQMEQRLENE